MSGLIILGYLCLLLSFIFGIVGVAIVPKTNPKWTHAPPGKAQPLHFNVLNENTTYSMFAQTFALIGLGLLYAGKN